MPGCTSNLKIKIKRETIAWKYSWTEKQSWKTNEEKNHPPLEQVDAVATEHAILRKRGICTPCKDSCLMHKDTFIQLMKSIEQKDKTVIKNDWVFTALKKTKNWGDIIMRTREVSKALQTWKIFLSLMKRTWVKNSVQN